MNFLLASEKVTQMWAARFTSLPFFPCFVVSQLKSIGHEASLLVMHAFFTPRSKSHCPPSLFVCPAAALGVCVDDSARDMCGEKNNDCLHGGRSQPLPL